jgi:RNase P/RNase MRP subunit p29
MILLGKTITVTHATNATLIGLTGEVIEDTKETLRITTPRGEKILVKNTITIETEGFIIEGKTLKGTHATRMKK